MKITAICPGARRTLAAAFLTALLSVSCNRIETFTGAFVAFDSSSSSTTSVDEEGDFTGEYILHYSGPKPSEAIVVSFEVTCGDGLAEGTDYEVVTTGGKVTFLPGVYEQRVRIHWLSHDIDESLDNTVTVSLTDAGSVTLGYPGPDKLGKSIVIRKYSLK